MSLAGLEDGSVEGLTAAWVSVVVEQPRHLAGSEVRPLVVAQHKPRPRPRLAPHAHPAPHQAGGGGDDLQPPLLPTQPGLAELLTPGSGDQDKWQQQLGFNRHFSLLLNCSVGNMKCVSTSKSHSCF